jgi:hypothetical protein
MSWIIPTALFLLAGFVCAFGVCEWVVRRRAESSRNRRLRYLGELRLQDSIPWRE